MLKQLIRYKRIKDYINYKETEVQISFVVTIFICVLFYNINLYNNINHYTGILADFILCLCGGFIGLIGFSLSGIAIMIGLFQKKQVEIIERINGIGILEKIMSSFAFIAYTICVMVVVLFTLYIILQSNLIVPSKIIFYIICFCIVYFILFCIFYTVSLVFNCIDLFVINNIYEGVENKRIYDRVNEIRIDYMLSIILHICNISKSDFLKGLDENAQNYSEEERNEIKEYFERYYKE